MTERKRIHRIKAVNEYEGHIAAYPDDFVGIIGREDNICIQYAPTTIVAIKNPKVPDELHRDIIGTSNMRVCTNGTDINTIGIRHSYPVFHRMLLEAIKVLGRQNHIGTLRMLKIEIERLIKSIDNG